MLLLVLIVSSVVAFVSVAWCWRCVWRCLFLRGGDLSVAVAADASVGSVLLFMFLVVVVVAAVVVGFDKRNNKPNKQLR